MRAVWYIVEVALLLTSHPLLAQDISWEKATGLPDGQLVQSLFSHPSGVLLAGTLQSAGTPISALYRSEDDGKTWVRVSRFPGGVYSVTITQTGATLVGTEMGGLFRSTDNGAAWEQVTEGLRSNRIAALVTSKEGPVYAGTLPGDSSGVYRSNDEGKTWTRISDGIRARISESGNYRPFILALFKAPTGKLYAGTELGVFVSEDTGESWSESTLQGEVHSLASNVAGHVFAGTFEGKVFRSLDGGRSWSLVLDDSSVEWVHDIAVNELGHVYVATGIGRSTSKSGGILRSLDNGETWARVGFEDTITVALSFDRMGHIIAGTEDGVWRSVESSINTVPQLIALHQNYPNPFDEATVIPFSLTNQSDIVITLYDVWGRKVTTVGSGFFVPGNHSLTWNVTNVASGTYFYRIQVGQLVQTRQLVLIR